MEPEIVAPDEKLTFRHIEAYLVEGLQAPTDGAKQIYSDKTVGKKVYLTDRSDDIWSYFDTAQSLAYSIVTTIVGIQAFSRRTAERWAENFAIYLSVETEPPKAQIHPLDRPASGRTR